MRITVVGGGYVGLVTAAGLAELGHDVAVVEVNAARRSAIAAGRAPFFEPGLSELLGRHASSRKLVALGAVEPPWDRADVYVIAVGTPALEDGQADVRGVQIAVDAIAARARGPALVVVKSTVPVGTCAELQRRIAGAAVTLEIASNPEFLREGTAVQDFLSPDRVVIGTTSARARATLEALYAPLQLSGARVVATDPASSELIKYAANTALAMRVSFVNELGRLCEATGADVHAIRRGLASDPRLGARFWYAGPGWGGSCLGKDIQAIMSTGKKYGVPMTLAEATHRANLEQFAHVARAIQKHVRADSARVTFWGLAFKPDTDDVRDAPSLAIAELLVRAGMAIVGHDPEAGDAFAAAWGRDRKGVHVAIDAYDALEGADVLVLLTEWRAYRVPDWGRVAERVRPGATVVDARHQWKRADVERVGLVYEGIGSHGA